MQPVGFHGTSSAHREKLWLQQVAGQVATKCCLVCADLNVIVDVAKMHVGKNIFGINRIIQE